MLRDDKEFDIDNFEFGPTTTSEMPLEALTEALVARDIATEILNEEQVGTLADFARLLDMASSTELATAQDAATLFDEELKITFVDDFRTTDGEKLQGAATESGDIYLDADLSGEALTSTLVEELAEAAYYDTFVSASQGDFGAEVAARLTGEADEVMLDQYLSETADDTVETEFGTAQANTNDVPDFMASPFAGDLVSANELIGVNRVRTNSDVRENLGGTLVTPSAQDFDLSTVQGQYDLNRDGVFDEYRMKAVYANVNSDLSVLDVTPTRLIPTSESQTVLIGQGEASTTWVLREEQTHSTTSEYNWNAEVTTELSTSGEIFGIGASASVSSTVGGGGSVTSSDSFTVANEVRDTYTIPAGAYDPGTLVNYGFHMVTGDVEVLEDTLYILEITNARDGFDDNIDFFAQDTGIVEDHYAGLVVTDYDVNNPPTPTDIFALA